jgi:hypothetical protein
MMHQEFNQAFDFSQAVEWDGGDPLLHFAISNKKP